MDKADGHVIQNFYSSGNKYVGQFRDDKRHGQGIFTWANGNKLVGQYKGGKSDGKGIFTFINGDKFVGEFANNEFLEGTYTYGENSVNAGDQYVGQFKDSKNGKGFLFWPDGRTDFCNYKNDKHSKCVGSNAYDVAVTLKNQFSALSTYKREKIQSGLKRRNLYTSSTDGKWGRGTLMALVEFSSTNLGTVDLQSVAASKKLLDAVLR